MALAVLAAVLEEIVVVLVVLVVLEEVAAEMEEREEERAVRVTHSRHSLCQWHKRYTHCRGPRHHTIHRLNNGSRLGMLRARAA
jgi:hypothetical protein